jgi:periplasmic protein TonB
MTVPTALSLLALALAAQAAPPTNLVQVANSPSPPVVVGGPPAPVAVVPAVPPARIVRAPQERRTTRSYVSADDYPAAALASGAHGVVGVILAIDPAGRVIGCTVTRSSGSAVLDVTTCRLLQRRARYTPAVDSNGNPAVGTIDQQVEWAAP